MKQSLSFFIIFFLISFIPSQSLLAQYQLAQQPENREGAAWTNSPQASLTNSSLLPSSPKEGWADLRTFPPQEQAPIWKKILIWPVNRVRDVYDVGVEILDVGLGIFGVDIQKDDLSP